MLELRELEELIPNNLVVLHFYETLPSGKIREYFRSSRPMSACRAINEARKQFDSIVGFWVEQISAKVLRLVPEGFTGGTVEKVIMEVAVV